MRYKTSYTAFEGSISQQLGPYHSLSVGAGVRRYTVRKYYNLNATTLYSVRMVDRYGYDSLGNEIEGDWQNGVKHPVYLSAYVQDRIELPNAIIIPSLRIDHFDYDAQAFIDLDSACPERLTRKKS